MTVRSRMFYGGPAGNNTSVVLYTVPAGRTGLLREFTAFNSGAVARTVTFYIDFPAGTARAVLRYVNLAPGEVWNSPDHALIAMSDARVVVIASGSGVFVTVSGSLLVGESA